MASGFPGAIDNFSDPLANSPLNSPSHATLHSDVNDAVEKIETYMGLVKVVPTSISSAGGTAATLSADGTINIGTSNTSITVNGAFSSLYDNYRIVVGGGVATGTLTGRLTLGASATGYYGVLIFARPNALTVTAVADNNANFFSFATIGNSPGHVGMFDLNSPALPVVTTLFSTISETATAGAMGTYNGYHNSAVSYTSFTLTASANSFTGGTIRIYGYRN